MSCEKGRFSTETEVSRIVNGVGYSQNVPVCQVCPLDTYTDQMGSSVCLSCPKYHTTTFTGATSIEDCLRKATTILDLKPICHIFVAQPLVLECSSNITSGHVTISCKTNRPVQKTLCSFNDELQHFCM